MDIWKATKKDVSQLSELFRHDAEYHRCLADYYELIPDFDWIAYTQEMFKGRNRTVFVAGDGGDLAGFVYIRIINYPPTNRYKSVLQRICNPTKKRILLPLKPMRWGVIEVCYVCTSFRRNGIGNKLVCRAMEWFQSKGVGRVELSVVARNKEADAFWRRLKFETFRVWLSKEI